MFVCCTETTSESLRKKAVDYLERNQKTLDGFHTDETFEQFCQKMRQKGKWGDHIMMLCIAEVRNMNIAVWCYDGANLKCKTVVKPKRDDVTGTIHVLHHGEYHYDKIEWN